MPSVSQMLRTELVLSAVKVRSCRSFSDPTSSADRHAGHALARPWLVSWPFPGWRLGARLAFMTAQRRLDLTNHHPAVVEDLRKHAEQTQLRIADAITKYAGSMLFVYVHIVGFAFWMLVLERSPWPTLTLVVSLEAIFLSTFVMIGQNRQAAFQQQKADHGFLVEEHELDTNTELTRTIARLTRDIHRAVVVTSNLIIEKVRRLAHGFKDFDHYRLRIMLAADGN